LPEPERPVRRTNWWASRVRFLGVRFTAAALGLYTPAMRAGNAKVFAIFCDRSARDVDPFIAEFFCDLLVSERVRSIFVFDHLLYPTLQGKQRHFAALRAVYRLAEEVAQFEDALRSVHVFIGYRAAHSGRMHADFLGDNVTLTITDRRDVIPAAVGSGVTPRKIWVAPS